MASDESANGGAMVNVRELQLRLGSDAPDGKVVEGKTMKGLDDVHPAGWAIVVERLQQKFALSASTPSRHASSEIIMPLASAASSSKTLFDTLDLELRHAANTARLGFEALDSLLRTARERVALICYDATTRETAIVAQAAPAEVAF